MDQATNKSQHSQDEERILEYWDKHQVFEKSVEQRPAKAAYVFYDGPPFATGLPHYGHSVASVMKDITPRFWTMKGKRVERVWGWDCHGLPIENIVEKKFNLGSKKDIENFGVDKFNDACRGEVLKYAQEWKKTIHRLGRWVDMEHSYNTMDVNYMESLWWGFKSLWEKGLIYEGYKPMHICPRCETALSNFEVTQNYQEVKDISVFISFPLLEGEYQGNKLVAWTTTPWTLPGNVLLAVGWQMKYVRVTAKDKNGKEDVFIVAKEGWSRLAEQGYEAMKTEEVPVAKLLGVHYEPLFSYYKDWPNAFRVVAADFVTADEGTGVVHIAPGFGEDDMALGQTEKVEPIMHVQLNGHFVPAVQQALAAEGFNVDDQPLKVKGDTQSVDIEILKVLAKRGRLVAKMKVEHSYPHCWRCDTPLLNYATTSWFVRVSEIKDRLVKLNKKINWVPENMKEGRFGKWLEGAHDWAVSRSRYWGTPLPIWRAEDGEIICLGSRAELEKLSGQAVNDLHKHVIDSLEIKKDGKVFHRIPEVLDCWFESGAMPYAQGHYPFENKEKFEDGFPAEFIAEGQDQTRGWFYTMHVLATALFNSVSFKNVVVNGIVLAEDGKKMSKRLQNYPDPELVINRYGADAVRYYLMASPVVRAENLRFSEAGVDEVAKKFITIMRNVLAFYKLYAKDHDGKKRQATHVLDQWILARLHETLATQTTAMEAYDFMGFTRVLQGLVTDLSTWYVRRSRERLKEAGQDKSEALTTLRTVLEIMSRMFAPITPFLAELIYQELDGAFAGKEARLSIHLADWPKAEKKFIDEKVLADMESVRIVVSRALERRAEAGKNVRQVLASATVTLPSGAIGPEYQELIKDEVNVHEVFVKKCELAVELDLEMTPALVREGTIREIIRRVNAMRKAAGLSIADRIKLYIVSDEGEIKKALEEHQETLLEGTLADTLQTDGAAPAHAERFRVNEFNVTVGFDK